MGLQPEVHQLALDLALDELAAGRELRLRVVSGSMAPLLRPGDAVILSSARLPEIRRGDLVLLHRGGEWVTHRLVCQDPAGWWTKGDNSRVLDGRAAPQEILGKVTAVERAGRRRSLDSPWWRRANPALGRLSWFEACLFQNSRDVSGNGNGQPSWPALGRAAARLFYGLRWVVDFLARGFGV